jgi:ribulose-5-phosphate 4-epimerase/fuculose-1-phosphate aldolase
MQPVEGVIKYQEEYTPGPPPDPALVRELTVWRRIFYELGVMGQDPERYDGAGFGNASMRLKPYDQHKGERSFVITGTQTGRLSHLEPDHFAIVQGYNHRANMVRAVGPIRASSESMTHGAVYDQSALIRWVFHIHAPVLWRQRKALAIPESSASVPYGTPAMAAEVQRLFNESDLRTLRIFAMAGHEDGIVSFGSSAADAAQLMIHYLVKARLVEAGAAPTR